MERLISDPMIAAALYTVLALICVFAGYRLHKLLIAVTIFGLSCAAAKALIGHFIGISDAVTGCSIIFGLVCAGMSYNLYIVGLFFLMTGLCIFLSWGYFANQWIGVSIGVFVGIPLGFLAVRANKMILIICTSLFGGIIAARYGALLLEAYTTIPDMADGAVLAIGIVLGVVGIVFQNITNSVSVAKNS